MTIPVLFLDDASRYVGTADRALAERLALTLLDTLKRLRKENKRFALNTAVPIAQYEVADGWALQSILAGNSYREEWGFIRSINDRSPMSAGVEEFLQQEISGVECRTKIGNVESVALAWASLLDSATVSCDTQDDWIKPNVDITLSCLQEDGALIETCEIVRNASRAEHVDSHIDWLQVLGLSINPSAEQIWSERGERFPGLRFLPRVEKDLVSLEGAAAPFAQAISTLGVLQNDVDNWSPKNAWPEFSTKTDPESQTRRQLCWVYDDVSGKQECFHWHKRFTGSFAGRIHFLVDEVSRKIVVAYVGAKLTKKIVS